MAQVGTPVAPTCRRSCPQGRAPGQSSAPTATAAGRGWAGLSPSQLGTRAPVLVAPQPHAGVPLSFCPVPPVVRPLPPSSLGFLPEEMREEAPRSRRQGCSREGEQGMLLPGLFLALAAALPQKGAPRGSTQPHRGCHLPGHLTCVTPLPLHLHRPPKLLQATSPQHKQGIQCHPPASTPMSHPMAGLKGGVPMSPMATQPDLCRPLKGCWPLSHLAMSPGALCQQMHRKHLFPTQGQLSQGGAPGWKLPLAMQELTPPCPALWDHPPGAPPHHS